MDDMDCGRFVYMPMTEAEFPERVVEAGVSDEARRIVEKRLQIIAAALKMPEDGE